MSKYLFKTNINCIGCASQIKPHLDKLEKSREIEHWNVHLTTPDHLLEIETNKLSSEEVKHYIREAGFEADSVEPPGLKGTPSSVNIRRTGEHKRKNISR